MPSLRPAALSRTAQILIGTAGLALAFGSSCDKKGDKGTTPPAPVAAAADDPAGEGFDATAVTATPAAAVEKISVVASVDGLDDILEAFKKLSEGFTPDEATDPLSGLKAQLLAIGFGPGFLGNIDLGGTHVFSGAFPPEGTGGPEDVNFSGSVAVKNGRKVIDSTPSAFRPQPLGKGMWEFSQDDLRVLVKEAGGELHVGMSVEDLDAAAKLQSDNGKGRRIRMRATNIPVGDIDPAELFDLPDIAIVRNFAKVVQDLEALELEMQIGTKSDFEFITSVAAPFHKLGLEPLGAPRKKPTKVEKLLPASPVVAMSLAYGDPKMLHKMIDATVPMGEVPEPFIAMATKTMKGVHGVLDQIDSDVTFAMYLDKKDQATIVLAADVKDDGRAAASLRSLFEVATDAVAMQKTMVGKAKDQAFEASFKKDSVKLPGGAKGDKLSLTLPAGVLADAKDAKMFLRKKELHVTTFVKDGMAVVAIGAGGRDLAAKVATSQSRPPRLRDSLAQDPGLKAVRSAMGGCQLCIVGGSKDIVRFRLVLARDGADDRKVAKEAAGRLKDLAKLGDFGDLGAGVRVEKSDASFGFIVPQTLLFAEPKRIEVLKSLYEFAGNPVAEDDAGRKG